TRPGSPASSRCRPRGAGWPVTRSGTTPASGRCRRRSSGRLAMLRRSVRTEFAMAHVFQVGAGSGGMPVLDLLAREPAVTRVTLVEPDVYKPHNVVRHLFPASAVGRPKGELAAQWLRERRPDLDVRVLACDLLDPARQGDVAEAAAGCDVGVCAADNEPAKYHFDL